MRPGPSMKVITPMTSPFAVSGTARTVETAWGSGVVRLLERRQLGPARPIRHRGGRRAVECARSRIPSREEDPLLSLFGPWTSSRTNPRSPGTCTTQESASRPSTRLIVRRITVVGSRLELSNRVTSESNDKTFASGFGRPQRLPFVFEDLGALQRLCGQAGERREETQVGFTQLGVVDESEGQDAERPNAADQRFRNDRDRFGHFRQHPRHHLGRQLGCPSVSRSRSSLRPSLPEKSRCRHCLRPTGTIPRANSAG